MGKGGVDTTPPQPTPERKPTAQETALTEESTALTRASREELQASAPLRRLLQQIGISAASSGGTLPSQIPALQRAVQAIRSSNARTRRTTTESLGASRLLNTPFGQAILANLEQNAGLGEAAVADAARTDAINQGFAASTAAGQLGVGGSQAGLGSLAQLVSSQNQRAAADRSALLGFTASTRQADASARAGEAAGTGSAIGSLAGLAALGIMFSHPDTKENVKPVKETELLKKLKTIKVSKWNYKWEPDIARIGGMTTDMPDEVTVGASKIAVDPVSYLGMLTGAIQALDKKVDRVKRARV